MKINKFLLIIISILIAQSAYSGTGYLKLIVNKNPNRYKVNVESRAPKSGDICFKKPGWNGFFHRDWQEQFPTDMHILDFIDYLVPKNELFLYIVVYDTTIPPFDANHQIDYMRQRIGTVGINDNNGLIQIRWAEGKADTSTTISSAAHDIAFRVIVEEDGTIKLAK